MVLLHVITNDTNQTDEIVDQLITQKLLLSGITIEDVNVKKMGHEGNIISEKQSLIMGTTKALLFNKIDAFLRDKYPDNVPTVYSIPIVNMDWEQADQLVKETKAI